MAKFLTTRSVTATLENIITDANEKLVLVSSYVWIPDNLIHRLKEAVQKKIDVTLVTRSTNFKEPEIKKWADIGLKVLVHEDLHAKAYFNENEAIVTSFNLYDYSELNNIEFGISVTKDENEKLYKKIVSESESIMRQSVPLVARQSGFYVFKNGFCIRCHKSIERERPRPYCPECYTSWYVSANRNQVEKYCHYCGKNQAVNMKYPLCSKCFEEN